MKLLSKTYLLDGYQARDGAERKGHDHDQIGAHDLGDEERKHKDEHEEHPDDFKDG